MGELYAVVDGVSKKLTPDASSGFVFNKEALGKSTQTAFSLANDASFVNLSFSSSLFSGWDIFLVHFNLSSAEGNVDLYFIVAKGVKKTEAIQLCLHPIGVSCDVSDTSCAINLQLASSTLYQKGYRNGYINIHPLA